MSEQKKPTTQAGEKRSRQNNSRKPASQNQTAKPSASATEKKPSASRNNAGQRQNTGKGGRRPSAANQARTEEDKSKQPSRRSTAANQGQSEAPTKNKQTIRRPAGERPTTEKKGGRGRRPQAPAGVPIHYTVLGGLNEIGKNMAVFEYGDDAFIIDCGMSFPDEDLLGVDVVLPDFTYALKIKDKLRGIFITHGHEDHIGALPYFLKELNLPVFSGRLTVALIESKLKEHNLSGKVKLHVVEPGAVVTVSKNLSVEFIHVNHSIPDAMALAVKTPIGYVVHTGDFKIDSTPVSGPMIDLTRFGELGKEGVLALLAESTNVERSGYTPSERVVGESFANLFHRAEGRRIIVATFSSNLNRIQQIMSAAAKDGRKVAVSGRSMINCVTIAQELGYLHIPDGLLIDIDEINHYPKDRVTLITTGSQGEPMSALSRMAFSDHRKVEVGPEDYIIISATPIPGNEKTVGRVVNELMKRGCEVVYEKMYDVHVSGHACQEELKIIHSLTNPRFFIPVHGEQKHLVKHANLAKMMGMPASNVLITDIGRTIEITPNKMAVVGTVPAGRVLVDGLGVGDVGSIVLRDRKHLAEDGLIVVVATVDSVSGELVSGPDVVSRGFVYVREAEGTMDEIKVFARRIMDDAVRQSHGDWGIIKTRVRDELSRRIFQKTKRSPMILPIIMEV